MYPAWLLPLTIKPTRLGGSDYPSWSVTQRLIFILQGQVVRDRSVSTTTVGDGARSLAVQEVPHQSRKYSAATRKRSSAPSSSPCCISSTASRKSHPASNRRLSMMVEDSSLLRLLRRRPTSRSEPMHRPVGLSWPRPTPRTPATLRRSRGSVGAAEAPRREPVGVGSSSPPDLRSLVRTSQHGVVPTINPSPRNRPDHPTARSSYTSPSARVHRM